MYKKIKKIRQRGYKETIASSRLTSKVDIIKIDKDGRNFIVECPYIMSSKVPITYPLRAKRGNSRRLGIVIFALGDTKYEIEIEKLLRKNHTKGGLLYVNPRVLNCNEGNDDGVWPPFLPKDIKIRIKNVTINKFKK